MFVPCSRAASGYVSLTPPRDLGGDLARALYRAGVRTGRFRKRARGYALLLTATQRSICLPNATIEAARAEAARLALTGTPVVVARAVGQGAHTVYERLEIIDLLRPAEVLTKEGKVVTPGGRALAPTVDVYSDVDLRAISRRLAGQLRGLERRMLEPRIRGMLERLDVNWKQLSATDRDKVWAQANAYMRATAVGEVLPQWEGKVAGTMTVVARGTRQRLRDEYLPRLGPSFRREETAALERLATQQGWFLRDRTGNISTRLTQRGRQIVTEGLRLGLGRNAIGQQLRQQLPDLATRWGANYANVVAANAVSRARSFAEISSYRDAGIMVFEAQAVLDERTTEYCRFIDGQIVDVQGAYDILQRAANASKPEDIYRESPFLTTVQTRTGPEIRTTTGARVAQVVRSGVGHVNDRGQFNAIRMGRGLPTVKIGMPPYHHACRTWTVPRVETFQIPRSYEVRTVAIRPVIGPKRIAPKVPSEAIAGATRGIFAVPTAPAPARTSVGRPPQRPLQFYAEPRDNRYAPIGDARPVDEYTLPLGATGVASARAQQIAGRSQNVGAVQNFVPGERGVQRFVQSGPLRAVRPTDGFHGTTVFRGAEGYADVFVRVHVPEAIRTRDIAALVVNPEADGRHVIFRMETNASKQRFIRVNPEKFPRRQAGVTLRQIEAGTLDDVAAERFVNDGVRRGWLRIGTALNDVSMPAHARTRATASGEQPKRLPAAPSSRAARPVAAKGFPERPPSERDTWEVASKGRRLGGLEDAPVSSTVYAARPPGPTMARAAWVGTAGLVQTLTVNSRGTILGRDGWEALPLTAEYFTVPRFDTLSLAPASNVIIAYYPRALGSFERDLLLAQILEGELWRDFDGVREYIVHDVRGYTTFVRYNGIRRRRTIPIIAQLLEGQSARARRQLLDLGIAQQEDTLARFYPAAPVDWSLPGVIPGVPLVDLVARRIGVVQRELQEQIVIAQGARAHFPPKRVFAAIVLAAAQRDASPVTPSAYLRGARDVNYDRYARRAVDAALEHASGTLLLALQTAPLPTFVDAPVSVSNYVIRPEYGGQAEPGLVSLRAQDALDIGWGRAGRWSPGQRHASRARVRRIFQHHIDRCGLNGAAATFLRNRLIGDGTPIDLFGDGTAFAPAGAWADDYDARCYDTDHDFLVQRRGMLDDAAAWRAALDGVARERVRQAGVQASEWMAVAHHRIARADPNELQLIWETAPEQIAGYIAMMRGAFVPFGDNL